MKRHRDEEKQKLVQKVMMLTINLYPGVGGNTRVMDLF